MMSTLSPLSPRFALPAAAHGAAAAAAAALPSRADAWWFAARAAGLRFKRRLLNVWQPVRRWTPAQALCDAPVLAEVRTPLWADGRAEEEFALVAGKVHNLRLAVQAFHGIEVHAGQPLSFWRQLGRVTQRRGFVLGREVREGCVIPTLGGGLCQLSNALANCIARAGGTLVERHRHTRRIEQATPAHAGAAEWVDA
ncbi:MAG: VanW family protein, partial [Pseudomonadota bacterium]